uniref:PX domain-containing protein n=1 Tax=Parascaris univalens TaxID=6257 RepID=A0A915BNA7_PARUN
MWSCEAIDITHPLRCRIVGWKRVASHVEYILEVERLLGNTKKWTIQRRYTQFSEVSKRLEKFGVELGLPPKKVIGNTKEQFIAQRKDALQKFLDVICSHSLFYSSPVVAAFFGIFPPTSIAFDEWILLSIRGKSQWALGEKQVNCGWRAGKALYELKCGRNCLTLSAIRYGPDRCGSVEGINEALHFIRGLEYPYVSECVASWADEKGVIAVRPAFNNGTLRDHLYKSNWRDQFFVKYCVERSVFSLEALDVRFICRQVLEALSLFCALSIPFVDVHAGNVSVSDCGCEVIDVEQVLAGQPSFHRPYMLKTSWINTIEDMMVFAFGEFLFELLTGFFSFPMNSANEGLALVPSIFQPILKSIFAPDRRVMPTLIELISSDLFVDIPVAKMNRREIRMPTSVKQLLDGLCENIRQRLCSDRAQQNRIQKEEKIRRLILSEGEKLRRKQIMKREQMKFSKPYTEERDASH